MSRFKRLYDVLLKNGELEDLFPNATGEWLKDKKEFIEQQEYMENLLNLNTVVDDDITYE